MKLHLFLTTLALLATTAAAQAGSPATTGALATPANRIVGVWSNLALIGPCGGAPNSQLRQTLMFEAGGGFVDSSPFPPGGLPNVYGVPGLNQRSIGVGAWSYDPMTDQYTLKQRFDWFVDNQYNGYQVVERTHMLISNNGNHLASDVHTIRYAANGAVIIELCGSATSARL